MSANMRESLEKFFSGKSVMILGFGREGRSTLSLIKDMSCKEIAVADVNTVDEKDAEGCTLYCGKDYLSHIGDYDIIMKAPGIGLKDDVSVGIKTKITSQTDLLLRFCPSTIIGVTGTKGKSTTSSLIYHFLKNSGRETMLIGNIGVPPLENTDKFTENTAVVCEMSCHQLEYVKASPDIAVLLNVYPEHLDHYTGFEAYKNAKLNIFRYQEPCDTLIVFDELKSDVSTAAKTLYAGFGAGNIGTRDGGIFVCEEEIPAEKINTRLKGEHNLYNIAIAVSAAQAAGCTVKQCLDSLADFHGLEHRLEYVGTVNGAEYINDSISTAPQTAIAALKAYPDTDTLIIGGMDRGISYDSLGDYLNGQTRLANLIILPDSGARAAATVTNPNIGKIFVSDMCEAVSKAKECTKIRCILSPAAASYGFYKNFEERGKHFKALLGF